MSESMQRRLLDTLGEYNQAHLAPRADNSNLAARIASYELAYRMQSHATEAVDLASETEATRRLYGIDNPQTQDFGRRCLLARRLVERGVRFIQLYSGGRPTTTTTGTRTATSSATTPTTRAAPRSRSPA